MDFARPHALFLLLLLILPPILAGFNHRRRRRLLEGALGRDAARVQVSLPSPEIRILRLGLVTTAIACLILALSGPRWGQEVAPMGVKGLDVVFLLDQSLSMQAQDIQPSRLDGARNLILQMLKSLQGDDVALVGFAGSAQVLCPLTQDVEAFELMLDGVAPAPHDAQGTDMGKALSEALVAFGDGEGQNRGRRMLVLLSDGEDHGDDWKEMMGKIKAAGVTVFAVGIASPGGAPIPLLDGQGAVTGWKKDRTGQVVQSRLDERGMQNLARETEGLYFRRSRQEQAAEALNRMDGFRRNVMTRRMKVRRKDRFQYPLALATMLLLLYLGVSDRT